MSARLLTRIPAPRAETILHAARNVALTVGTAALLTAVAAPAATARARARTTLPVPISYRHLAVPEYRQQESDDCEAASLRMVLAYRGIRRSDAQLLATIGVDLKHPGFGRSGSTSGDPYRAFVGSPNGSEVGGSGYGVFYPRIAAAASADGAKVLLAQQSIAPDLLYLQVLAGHPAVVWIDYLYRALPTSWYRAYDGRLIPYEGPAEHAVAIVGVSETGVYINDPARGSYWVSKARFEAGYNTYHDMAVVIS